MAQDDTFRALVLNQVEGKVQPSIEEMETSALPEGDVLVRVAYSDLNYKDGLAVTGQGRIIRSYPAIPGIDFAGVVEESQSPRFQRGDEVVLTGWGVGERHWGGYAQKARVKSDWLVALPKGLSLEQAMGIGTAGFTAMLCVIALEAHGLRERAARRPVIVTGATGGVGSIAVAILAHLGYQVTASTGSSDAEEYLRALGAQEVIGRIATPSRRPLESERWGGAVDTVGGETLASLLPAMAYGAGVTVCGLAGGSELNTTVMPFILRGVNLLGIESVSFPAAQRPTVWERLARDLPLDALKRVIQVVPLTEVPRLSQDILKGRTRGRIVIDINA
ncbi:MAG TPA: MDR family oxidoreductase [Ktedonobacteraceae bacterium]|nr:MDR family oxidoreductase [Ktedonobacteraceae bacterium]